MDMKRDLKTGILLIVIGFTATIGLIFITGKQAMARNQTPNPAYSFGFCIYEMQGNITGCYKSVMWVPSEG